MIVVFLGAPGSGKGTQAAILAERFGYRSLSTGECLRKHVKGQTPIGLKVKEIMDRGELVSDEILLDVLNQEIGSDNREVILLDGYPRNLEQAKTLAKLPSVHKLKSALFFDVPQNKLMARLTGRRVCEKCGANYHIDNMKPKVSGTCDKCSAQLVQRTDDNEEKVKVRLDLYESVTKPLVEYYESLNLLSRIDADQDMNKVAESVQKILSA